MSKPNLKSYLPWLPFALFGIWASIIILGLYFEDPWAYSWCFGLAILVGIGVIAVGTIQNPRR